MDIPQKKNSDIIKTTDVKNPVVLDVSGKDDSTPSVNLGNTNNDELVGRTANPSNSSEQAGRNDPQVTTNEKANLLGLKNLPISVSSQKPEIQTIKAKEFIVPKKPDAESKISDEGTTREYLTRKIPAVFPKKELGWKTLTPTVNIEEKDLPPKKSIIQPAINKPTLIIDNSATFNKEKTADSVAKSTTDEEKGEISTLPTLRTYKKDVAGTIKGQKTSLVRMVLEEQKGRAKRELNELPQSRKNLPLIFFSIIFFLLAIGVVYYAFFRTVDTSTVFTKLNTVPLIGTEYNKEVLVTEKSERDITDEITRDLGDMELKLDTVEYVYFTEQNIVTTDAGLTEVKNILNITKLFDILHIKIPTDFLRSLKNDYMFGFHNFSGNQPFLILKTDYYDSAFAGMLEWEPTILTDLYPLFGITATDEMNGRTWADFVVKNKDTRELKDFNGQIILAYMFKDRNTLIISTSENTLFEVARRLDLLLERK
jgi:hypothetical protein